MTLEASGILADNTKFQYLCTILPGEALHKFDNLCNQIRSMTVTQLNQSIFGLVVYFPPVNLLSKKIT